MASRITSESEKSEINNTIEPTLESLPNSILLDVIAEVGSKSVADLHNLKMCSKDFGELTYNNYVLNKVSFENSPLDLYWEPNENALRFLQLCEASGNLEVLFSEGLREFFNWPIGNIDGLEKVKIAAEGGHNTAKYAYGLIMLSSENDESREEGIKHIRNLRLNKCIMDSRRKMKEIEGYFWRYNGMLVRNQTPVCKSQATCNGWKLKDGIWTFSEDEDDDIINSCENCRWDHELQFFYGLFNGL